MKSSGRYILNRHTPVECTDLRQWAEWIEKAERHVAKTKKGKITVSTVFLGLDHSFGGKVPILFETMVFGGRYDEEAECYATWEEAEKGHKRICKKVFPE